MRHRPRHRPIGRSNGRSNGQPVRQVGGTTTAGTAHRTRTATAALGKDPMADFRAIYDRTAATYATEWDGHVTPALAEFAQLVGDGGVILDAGCGPGRDLAAFESLGVNAVGVDNSVEMVALAVWAGRNAMCEDICNLSFDDAVFAGVWASASLVHLDDTEAATALAELARVTRPGGHARIIVKAAGGGRGRDGWEGDGDDARWFRYWDLDEFVALAEANGWSCVDAHLEADSRRAGLEWVTATFVRA